MSEYSEGLLNDAALGNYLTDDPGSINFGDTLRDKHSTLASFLLGLRAYAGSMSDESDQQRTLLDRTNRSIDDLELLIADEEDTLEMARMQQQLAKLTRNAKAIEATLRQTGPIATEKLADALETVLIPGFSEWDDERTPMNSGDVLRYLDYLRNTCAYTHYEHGGWDDGRRVENDVVDFSNNSDVAILNNFGAKIRENQYLYAVGGEIDFPRLQAFLTQGASDVSYLNLEINSMNSLSRVNMNPVAVWLLFGREFSGAAYQIYEYWDRNMRTVSGVALLNVLMSITNKPASHWHDETLRLMDMAELDSKRSTDTSEYVIDVIKSIGKLEKMRDNDPRMVKIREAIEAKTLEKGAVIQSRSIGEP